MIDLDTIEQHATGAGSNQSGSAFISPVTVIEMVNEIRRLRTSKCPCDAVIDVCCDLKCPEMDK